MEFLFDDSHDWIRLVVLVMCLICAAGLLYRRFNPPNDEWNPKTKDYWFALLMFSVAGSVSTLETLRSNQDFAPKLIFTGAAALICMNGLRRSGRWRGDDEQTTSNWGPDDDTL